MPVSLPILLACAEPPPADTGAPPPPECAVTVEAWTSAAPLPEPTEGLALAAGAGRLVALGGWNGRAVLDRVLVTDDPAAGWTEGAPLPAPREHLGAAWVGDHLVALGGDDGTARAEVWVSDGALAGWTAAAPLPVALTFPAVAATDTDLYVAGGLDADGRASREVLRGRVDPDGTVRWSAGPPLPAPVLGAAAVVVDGHLVVLGGAASFDAIIDAVAVAEIGPDGALGDWTEGPPLPRPSMTHAAVAIGDRIVLAGGFDGVEPSRRVHVGDLAGDWTAGERLPGARFAAGAARFGDRLVLVGGWTDAFASLTDETLTTPVCP